MKKINRTVKTVSTVLLVGAVLAGCGNNANNGNTGSSTANSGTSNTASNAVVSTDTATEAAKVEVTDITQVVNWFPQPEHGGQFAADEKGFYEEAGFENMEILPGGPQVSSMQIVASGKAQFGLGIADDILMARENGLPLVAVASVFQESPNAIMTHKSAGIDSLDKIEGHNVIIASGSNFWPFIKAKFDFKNITEQTYTGSLVEFVNDPNSVIQSFSTSEPYVMDQEGVDIELRMVSESGYNPYMNLIFTTEDFIKENPETVRQFVAASLKGWDYYKDNFEEINPVLQEGNPDVPLEKMAFSAEAAMELIYTGDALEHGVGYMSEERWQELADQLVEVGLLKEGTDVSGAFTTEFLPQE